MRQVGLRPNNEEWLVDIKEEEVTQPFVYDLTDEGQDYEDDE